MGVLAETEKECGSNTDNTPKNCSSNLRQTRNFDFIDEAISHVEENHAGELFKDSRQYADRKRRSCRKRDEPLPDDKKREENSRNSRNYTKRNRDEIAYYEEQLRNEKRRLDELCSTMNNMMRYDLAAHVRLNVNWIKSIVERDTDLADNLDRIVRIDCIETFYHEFEKRKGKVHEIPCSSPAYIYEEEYEKLKNEYESLLREKDEYISDKGRTNFASAKSRLRQRLLRAELKRECYTVHCAGDHIQQKIDMLSQIGDQLKQDIWDKCVSIYDRILILKTEEKMSLNDLESWKRVKQFFMTPSLELYKKTSIDRNENNMEISGTRGSERKDGSVVVRPVRRFEEDSKIRNSENGTSVIRKNPLGKDEKRQQIQPMIIVKNVIRSAENQETMQHSLVVNPNIPVGSVLKGIRKVNFGKEVSKTSPNKSPL